MLSLGPLTFAVPAALLAMVALPALWWLLRVTPPAPRRLAFPAVLFLLRLAPTEETVRRTPPWLLALRLGLAAAVILGCARPLFNASAPLSGSGPVVIIIDDGWAAARDWPARQAMATSLIDRAERESRPLVVLTTSLAADVDPATVPRLLGIEEARQLVAGLQPKPWQVGRTAALEALLIVSEFREQPPAALYWLGDGLDNAADGQRFVELAEALRPFGTITVVVPDEDPDAVVLRPPEGDADGLLLKAERAGRSPRVVWVEAQDENGTPLARHLLRFEAGRDEARGALALPAELRNRLARLHVEGEPTAAAVVLVDDRWRRRPVGLVVGDAAAGDLPLLSPFYYVDRALEPIAEVRKGGVEDLLARDLAVLVLADAGPADAVAEQRILDWIERGGVLLRFAGPSMTQEARPHDRLLPVALRIGDRTLGGSLAWHEPAGLAGFGETSPFFGLEISKDVQVSRQVLAEPSLELAGRTWAQLDDGTPLVTAARRGDGWLVLFHTTANTDWSSLPLSGLFVQMLERIIGLSGGSVARPGGPPLRPVQTLDGFGRLVPPPSTAKAVAAHSFGETEAGPSHPPGWYGRGGERMALNLGASLGRPLAVGPLPDDIGRRSYAAEPEVDLRPWLWSAALLLALVDLVISMVLRGLFSTPALPVRRWMRSAGIALIATHLASTAAAQQTIADGSAVPDALTTRLAFVITGDAETDALSRAGLTGLALAVNRRTAAELSPPVGVDPERDDLVFYPFVYWPVVPGVDPPSQRAARTLRSYMASGGTILFDMRSRGSSVRLSGLRELAGRLDIPPLIPVPRDHILTRAYYLMSDFPGRWSDGPVWVERRADRVNDGVTTVIVGSQDWAGAWAVDDLQRPILPVIPGGERQREMAYRFGINVVMYVLAGNYKADQVHLPAILERLGR